MQRDSGASDNDLLRKSTAGDGAAFHKLVNRHADRLYALAMSMIRNAVDAEDVLQETFAGAYRGLAKFESRASVKTWLTRILILQIAKWRRDRRGDGASELQESSASRPSGESEVDQRIDLQAALAKLSPEHQEVLLLREFEQLSYEEIAGVLDVPRGTVESRLFRARAELREKLEAYRAD